MSEPKDSQDDHDPDYDVPGPSNEAHQKLFEEHARTNVARKITAIVEKEFSREIDTKEKEILEIEERLHKALKTLHFLRYVIITNFYNRKQCQNVQAGGDSKQTRIHPAIKQIIGKSPRVENNLGIPSTSKAFVSDEFENSSIKTETKHDVEASKRLENSEDVANDDETTKNRRKRDHDEIANDEAPAKKIPRYVPPKSGIPEPQVPSRGARHKVRKRIVVGNISKWIPPDWREDAASHKWTMYVRGSKENADISDFVGKVRFFLHPSYRPNDVVEVTSPPFHLSRRGWGEFPLRVQLHFKNPLNKPMDIIHYLKLDRTYTGLQTLGSETVVDVWIKSSPDSSSIVESTSIDDVVRKIKKEPNDVETTCEINSEDRTICHDFENPQNSKCCQKIKKECEDTRETVSHVRLEHDYANFNHENSGDPNENNVTIAHSPPRDSTRRDDDDDENSTTLNSSSTNGDRENYEISTKISTSTSVTSEKIGTTDRIDVNSTSNNLQKVITKTSKTSVGTDVNYLTEFEGIDSSKINPSVDVKTMISSLDDNSSKLQPLTISIPPGYESSNRTTKDSTKNKQIMVVRDKKLFPVESLRVAKIGTTIGRGVSLLKKPPNPNAIGRIGKSDGTVLFKLNPKNSLILNANDDVPALRIVESPIVSDASRRMYVVDGKIKNRINVGEIARIDDIKFDKNFDGMVDGCKIVARPRVTLGKDRIGTTSKREIYQQILRSIDDADITDVAALVRFVIRRIPLVTEKATDPDYRILHPYACASEKEFLDSNVGKQRALEWYRAKHVKSFFKKKQIPEDLHWSVKEIMIWSRLHGHTPMRKLPIIGSNPRNTGIKSSEKNIPEDRREPIVCTLTEPVGLMDYLRKVKETRASAGPSETKDVDDDDDVEIIDVENIVEDDRSAKKIKKFEPNEENTNSRNVVCLGIPEKIVGLQSYVTNTSRQIGIKLGPEEIVEGVTHCAAARLIVRTVQCLIEDLLRSSLAKAWERSSDGGCPDTITLEDVRGAILSREEFDVFTNEGLGSTHCPNE